MAVVENNVAVVLHFEMRAAIGVPRRRLPKFRTELTMDNEIAPSVQGEGIGALALAVRVGGPEGELGLEVGTRVGDEVAVHLHRQRVPKSELIYLQKKKWRGDRGIGETAFGFGLGLGSRVKVMIGSPEDLSEARDRVKSLGELGLGLTVKIRG